MTMNLPIVTDSFTLYLAEIRRFPLLDADEEKRLAVSFYEEKDLAAAHLLITSNLRFVVKICSEYRAYGMKMLDLIQEGNIGLMMAVRKFNPYKGVRLISYAVWWIRAYIQNFILSAWSLVKIGTTHAQRKLFYGLRKAKETLFKLTGSDADAADVANMLQVSDQDVVEMDQRLKREISVDEQICESDRMTVLETIPDERMNQEELLGTFQQERQLKQQVTRALEGLSEKERYVIERRVTSEVPLTLQEIADHFSISRERVRQIEERALAKLRQILVPQLAWASDTNH